MGTKNNPGKFDGFAKAGADEPLFTLLARDPSAPGLIWMWASLREMYDGRPEQIQEARQLVQDMIAWQRQNGRDCLGFGQAAMVGVLELIRSVNAGNQESVSTTPTSDAQMRLFLAQTKFEHPSYVAEKADSAFFEAAATFCEMHVAAEVVRAEEAAADGIKPEQYKTCWREMLDAYKALRATVVEPAAPKCATCGDDGVIKAAGAGQTIGGEPCPALINCPDCNPSDVAQRLRAPVGDGGGFPEKFDDSAIARAEHLVASPDVTGSHQECRKLLAELLAMVKSRDPFATEFREVG